MADHMKKADSAVPRTTDPAAIARFLGASDGAARVVFATYHSAMRVSEALASLGPARRASAISLLVCDEAHRCTGTLATSTPCHALPDVTAEESLEQSVSI